MLDFGQINLNLSPSTSFAWMITRGSHSVVQGYKHKSEADATAILRAGTLFNAIRDLHFPEGGSKYFYEVLYVFHDLYTLHL